MKIAIIGAGFTGLAAGFKLVEKGFDVTIFEANDVPGGLAIGIENKNWKWSLEQHYHHLFKTDYAIQKLAKDINYNIDFIRPKTSTFYRNSINQIDSPINLLKFKHLSIIDRFRTGVFLGYLKLTNSWRDLEKRSAKSFLIQTMGLKSWEVLWNPLMKKKFGKYAGQIPASWFWARVKSRTAILGYPDGGFKRFAEKLGTEIEKKGGHILYKTKTEKIALQNGEFTVKTNTNKKYKFDRVICTLPNHQYVKIVDGLPKKYVSSLKRFKGIGAMNLVLVLNKSFLEDGTYWLNINETEFPFLCIVEHTNFINSKKYGGKKIIYIGNYLSNTHKYFLLSESELLNEYLPFLKKINTNFKKNWISQIKLFKAPFAQPIVTKNYSKKVPPIKTPVDGLYLANIQQVYPWDRGTNYAVDLGNKAVETLMGDIR